MQRYIFMHNSRACVLSYLQEINTVNWLCPSFQADTYRKRSRITYKKSTP